MIEETHGGEAATARTLHAQPATQLVLHRPPQQTLEVVQSAGLDVDAATVTTTDWSRAEPQELAMMMGTSESGAEDDLSLGEVVTCFDAQGTPVLEAICDCCRGAGHFKRDCPSANRYRSFGYVIGLIEAARQRSDSRRRMGSVPGGRRSTPRGQRTPLSPAVPRSFSPTARTQQRSAPFRRFARPQGDRARLASDEGPSDEGESAEEGGTVPTGGAPPERVATSRRRFWGGAGGSRLRHGIVGGRAGWR